MIAVKVTCHNGRYWKTRINGDIATARAYFIGRPFWRERHDGREVCDVPCAVELLPSIVPESH